MKIHLTVLLLLVSISHNLCATESVPNPPQIKKMVCNRRDALINWVHEDNKNTPTLRYIIEYSTDFVPDTWEIIYDQVPSGDTSYSIPLSPCANYTFRIKAVNSIGHSIPSQQSEICTTLPDVPYKNPENIKGEGHQPDNLVISWDVMLPIDHNAPGFHYRVYWKRNMPGLTYETQDIFDWQRNQFVVSDTPSFNQYLIKIVAINELGEANVSPKEVIGYSGEEVPLLAPENISLVEIMSPTAALLSWDPVPSSSVRGHFKGYLIMIWSNSTTFGYKEILVEKNSTNALLDNLDPFSRYFAHVHACNGKYKGPHSNTISFDTPEGVPGLVSALEAYPLGSSNFHLTWRKPERPNGILKGYKVYFAVIKGISVGETIEVEPEITDPNQLQTKLSGLMPNTRYCIYVTAFTDAGESERYYIERKTELPRTVKPSEPGFTWQLIPGNITSTVRITWLPNLSVNPGDHFYVKYRKGGEAVYIRTNPEFNFEYLDIGELEPEQTYEFIVVAVDGDFETPSEPKQICLSSIELD